MLKGKCEFSATPVNNSALLERKRGWRPLKSECWSCENYSQGGSCHGNLLSLHHGYDPGPMKMVCLVPWRLADASVCVCTAVPSATERCWPQANLACMLCTRGEDVTVRPLFCFEGNVLPFSASMVVPNLHLQGIKHEGITTNLKQKTSDHTVIPEVNLFGLFS